MIISLIIWITVQTASSPHPQPKPPAHQPQQQAGKGFCFGNRGGINSVMLRLNCIHLYIQSKFSKPWGNSPSPAPIDAALPPQFPTGDKLLLRIPSVFFLQLVQFISDSSGYQDLLFLPVYIVWVFDGHLPDPKLPASAQAEYLRWSFQADRVFRLEIFKECRTFSSALLL